MNNIPGSSYTTKIIQLRNQNFDFQMTSYPIFDENYRNVLNKKILDHYNWYEIGFETAGRFRQELNIRLNEIMPLYNKAYIALNTINNPILSTDLTEEFNRSSTGKSLSDSSSNSSQNSENNSKHLFQDTPQGNLSNLEMENQTYATELNLNKNNINTSTNDKTSVDSQVNNTEDYIKKIYGINGNKSIPEIFNEYFNSLINIDLQIINNLSDLFMGIW